MVSDNDRERPRGLRHGAYLMVADAKWIAPCLRSIYPLVDRIVISYDEQGRGYAGEPVDFDSNLQLIRSLDADRKMIFLPGRFFRPEHDPMENETNQRRVSLAALGDQIDWVIQLDTDEVLLDPAEFINQLHRADAAGRDGLEYPARWLFADLGDGRYLERSRRLGGIAASYPGPVAIRAGVSLDHSRQGATSLWRVDFRATNTDPWHGRDTPIDAVVDADQGIAHFSWVRSEAEMRAKALSSAHAKHFDWTPQIDRWLLYQRQPRITQWRSRLGSDRNYWMRVVRLPGSLSLDGVLP